MYMEDFEFDESARCEISFWHKKKKYIFVKSESGEVDRHFPDGKIERLGTATSRDLFIKMVKMWTCENLKTIF